MDEKTCFCYRCKSEIKRTVESCTKCLRDFHPKCSESSCHKIFDECDNLIPCRGPYEIYQIQSNGKKNFKRRRTISNAYNPDELEGLLHEDNNSQNKNISKSTSNNTLVEHLNDGENEIGEGDSSTNQQDLIKLIKNQFGNLHAFIQEIVISEISKCRTETNKEISELKMEISELKMEIVELKKSVLSNTHQISCDVEDNTNSNRITSVKEKEFNSDQRHNKVGKRIYIRPLENQESQETINKLKSKVDVVSLGVGIDKVISKPDGVIIIDLDQENENIKLTNEIKKGLGETYSISPLKKKFPKLKIVGLDKEMYKLL